MNVRERRKLWDESPRSVYINCLKIPKRTNENEKKVHLGGN